jgi:HTH-type transcriptional regulator/antitoxin HigA
MHVADTPFDIRALTASWRKFDAMTHLRPIHGEADYDRMVALMNAVLDVVGEDEDHALSGLLDLVSDLVSAYEARHHAIEPAEPRDALRFLMEARGLKQEDLSGIVAQSNLSAILAGKRSISAPLAGKLARFFDVSPALFIPA